ncbi:MAG: tRNA (adenosine(37)-N6)-threonylcarbamoyltransferase complex ATPase subunit type 1 TsaE [Planctomycetes bacterium]|nr:tRNA (adenosine(37)-N6)-threonylcarbamoyltransferase complex ATPase subunit type 1 TsaE [Planctomycetota bacterium]
MSTERIERELYLPDAAATAALGATLGAHLRAGQALALIGELGAGKTCLARGVAHGLGVDAPEEVASPTYLLVVEHEGPVPMLHVDAYLPDKTRAFLLDGGLGYLDECGGVAVIEWADRLVDLWPAETLEVRLADDGRGGRVARLAGPAGAFGWLAAIGAPARGD